MFDNNINHNFPKASNNNLCELSYAKLDPDFVKSINQTEKKLLDAIFGNSSYLSQIICDYQHIFKDIVSSSPKEVFDKTILSLKNYDFTKSNINQIKSDLRIFKKQLSLIIAIADISNFWNLEEITKALTDTAELTLGIACRFLIHQAVKENQIEDIALEDSGYFIIGMGKLGAYELNYSSDIDLIVLFDDKKVTYKGKFDTKRFFNNITKDLVAIMQERTPKGYVFRTDLRLRPDPSSTPIAMTVGAAEAYYESFGQNWERAAMIKARPVAGDINAGYQFLKNIKPFVWRKSLDFKAIKDIHSIKGQILSRHGKDYNDELLGYNVKLGRGGIREIEFFAQSQQLIWGGRNPALQKLGTKEALDTLVETGYISEQACEDLKKAYNFLRNLEHRLQMVEDRQTHELPKREEDFNNIAIFCGFDNKEEFVLEVKNNFQIVEKYFSKLFEEDCETKKADALIFEANNINENTLSELEKLGFRNNKVIYSCIHKWLSGHPRATRTSKAKELLTKILPHLLKALSETSSPDVSFARFDEFLYAQPAGVQLFYLFDAKPSLFNLIAKIMGDAPSLALELKKKPELLDNIIEPDFFTSLPPKEELEDELKNLLNNADNFEQKLDAFRRFKKYRSFQLCVQLFENIINGEIFGQEYSILADVIITLLKEEVLKEFSIKYGIIKGAEIAVLALGKAGSREMSPNSDLDLIIIYDVPDVEIGSIGGEVSLAASTYFARLTTRFTNALNVMTAEGKLWDIDMRLRPSGNAGPLATSLEAFTKYQKNDAWVWEHQALTRARVVCGDDKIEKKIKEVIKKVLSEPRDKKELAKTISDMRIKISQTHKSNLPFGIKYMEGGMVDIEFIIQYLKLAYAYENPDILVQNTTDTLINIKKAKIIKDDYIESLDKTYKFWLSLLAVLNLTVDKETNDNTFSKGLKLKLTKTVNKNISFDELKQKILKDAKEIKKIYKNIF